MKVWILVYVLSPVHSIEVATYDTFADCDEIAYYMQRDGLEVHCHEQ